MQEGARDDNEFTLVEVRSREDVVTLLAHAHEGSSNWTTSATQDEEPTGRQCSQKSNEKNHVLCTPGMTGFYSKRRSFDQVSV